MPASKFFGIICGLQWYVEQCQSVEVFSFSSVATYMHITMFGGGMWGGGGGGAVVYTVCELL